MSHLVVDHKDLKSKKEADLTNSELESEELKQHSPKYVNQIVCSDKKIDQQLILLYRALNARKYLSKELTSPIKLDENISAELDKVVD